MTGSLSRIPSLMFSGASEADFPASPGRRDETSGGLAARRAAGFATAGTGLLEAPADPIRWQQVTICGDDPGLPIGMSQDGSRRSDRFAQAVELLGMP
ncbi:hypothetical protein [Methylobacterium sp. UNC378MF]|uniref:hypothetical protein n=1 Tax=Methylobacterium sp. UNC378MF TaxID=1502748 RepID=UPI0015873797|nr:hypothetical protein [Methylobacterium sp. UNC378MF]